MAHFAQLDSNNIVTQVIVVSNADTSTAQGEEKESIGIAFCERLFGGTWVKTSYNGSIRKNYAGIGYTYDKDRDAFISPKPFNSWTLDEATCHWKAPVDMPADVGQGDPPKMYTWDESTTSWKKIEIDYESLGYTYDKDKNIFIPPKPFNSWILNESTNKWEPPVAMPLGGKPYVWDESTISWKEVEINHG